MLELYHYEPYANSMKNLICLEEKGLGFVSRYVDILRFEQHEPWFLALNPNGQVPILVHDGRVIVESTVINEYLEDVFPQVPLRPADPYERHRMRVFSKWNDEVLMPYVSRLGWHTRFHPYARGLDEAEFQQRMARVPLYEIRQKWETTRKGAFTEDQLEEARRNIRWMIARMEDALRRSAWLAGESYSLADINTYPQVEGVTRLYPEFWTAANAPRSIEWLARISERPAVKAAFATSRFKTRPDARAMPRSELARPPAKPPNP